MHDILEDTDVVKEELRVKGFNERVAEAVEQMSNNKGLKYGEYIKGIESDIARVVKMADLTHNMDISRLGKSSYEELSKGQKNRVNKYRLAIEGLVKDEEEMGKLDKTYSGIKKGVQ